MSKYEDQLDLAFEPIPPTHAVGDPETRNVLDALSRNIQIAIDTFVPKTTVDTIAQLAADASATTTATQYVNNTAPSLISSAVAQALSQSSALSASLLVLQADGLAFIYQNDKATASASPDIHLTAQLTNLGGTVTFVATAFDASKTALGSVTLTGTGNTRTLTAANFNALGATTTRYVEVTATLGPLSDRVTIYRGDGGSHALVMILTNEAHTVAANNTGTVLSFSGATTDVKVYEGVTDVTNLWTFTKSDSNTGSTLTGNGTSTVTVALSALTQDNGYVTITATRSGYDTLTKVFSVSKSTAGQQGQQGAQGPQGPAGANGANGADGQRGSLVGYGTQYGIYLSSWSDYAANAVIFNMVYGVSYMTSYAGTFHLRLGDTVTLTNGSSFAQTRYWSGYNWATPGTVIDGNLLVTGTITGDKIAANSLSVDRLTSGNTASLYGGVFGLGGSQTLNGYQATGRFSANISGRFAMLAFQESTSDGNAAVAGAHLGTSGYGGAFYSAYDTNYVSFYTVGAVGGGIAGGIFKLNRTPYVYGNLSLLPVSECQAGTDDNGAYIANYGYSAYSAVTQAFIGNKTTLSAMVARRYTTDGSTLLSEVYIARDNYAIEAYQKKIYAAIGYAPFTGVHDGLLPDTEAAEEGDIVVDYAILKHIDISNSIAEFRRSSQPNQKGVIGVLAVVFDEPPADWFPLPAIPEPPVDGQQEQIPVPKQGQANTGDYDVPAGMRVVHVNALGEGLINVCGEGGDIERGDLIVTSSLPGKGMRQADDLVRSYTVAKAREGVTFSSPTEVKQIACVYVSG